MQHDEIIWQVIRHKHCSYMAKIETAIFCRNPYNVTGTCNRSSCPLANSRYATIRNQDGVFYLYMKTIERSHMPKDLWERIKLPQNYEKALELIDKHLLYWPKLLQHKVKQRLTKMTQMRIRMKNLALKTRETIITSPRRPKKRELRREEKALAAAKVEKVVEDELLVRLKAGVYASVPEMENLREDLWNKALDAAEKQKNTEYELEDEVEEEDEEEPVIEYVEGYDELEDEEEEDMEDFYGLPSKESHLDGDDQDTDDEDGEDAEEKVVIHKRGRASKKSGDNGKLKKKKRVSVEFEQDGGETRQTFKSLRL